MTFSQSTGKGLGDDMGFCVVHMIKIKAGGVRGIQSHNNREKPPRTNPDIDTERTAENYDLIYAESYQRSIKAAITNFARETKTVRKDAVVLCNFVITSDEKTMKVMSPERQREFFEDTVKWFANRYGAETIVNATVHMDETTPHMHLGLVPITRDRLSAKILFDKKEMTAIQTDFAKDVGQKYGMERGKEGSERTHLSEERFKALTAAQEAEESRQEITPIQEYKDNLEHDIRVLEAHRGDLVKANPSMKLQIENAQLRGRIERMERWLHRLMEFLPEKLRDLIQKILDDRDPFRQQPDRGREK